jgi:hypothetical protein
MLSSYSIRARVRLSETGDDFYDALHIAITNASNPRIAAVLIVVRPE